MLFLKDTPELKSLKLYVIILVLVKKFQLLFMTNMVLSLDILEAERDWESLCCTAHTLQLCLKAGFEISGIARLLACACKLVGHFHHSVVATEALKKRQTEMNLHVDGKVKKLIRDCVTRWNSSYLMLERLLKLRWPVTAVLSDETITKRSDQYLDLKTDQWVLCAELVKVLEFFAKPLSILCFTSSSWTS